MRVRSRVSSRSRSWPITSARARKPAPSTLVEPFMRGVVANFDNTWEMTSADVAAAIDAFAST